MPTRDSEPGQSFPGEKSGYERSDVRTGWIFGVVFFLGVSGIVIHFLMARTVSVLAGKPAPTDAWRPAISGTTTQAVGFPRLQVSPPSDLQAFREREEAELNSYGWIDQTSGIVRIPIEQAIERVLSTGLPTRHGTNQPKTGASTYDMLQQRAAGGDRSGRAKE